MKKMLTIIRCGPEGSRLGMPILKWGLKARLGGKALWARGSCSYVGTVGLLRFTAQERRKT